MSTFQYGFLVGAGVMFITMHIAYLSYLTRIGQLPWKRPAPQHSGGA